MEAVAAGGPLEGKKIQNCDVMRTQIAIGEILYICWRSFKAYWVTLLVGGASVMYVRTHKNVCAKYLYIFYFYQNLN